MDEAIYMRLVGLVFLVAGTMCLVRGEFPTFVEDSDDFNRLATGGVARLAAALAMAGALLIVFDRAMLGLMFLVVAWAVGWLGGRPAD